MSDTPEKAAKKAHAAAIIAALEAVQVLIVSEPEAWWGGLPPAFTQLQGMLSLQQNVITTTFELLPET